jgi:hypothetical protein
MHKVNIMLNEHYVLLTNQNSLHCEFDGIYATDLLSTAIKHIKHKEALITIIATQTAISLAVMLDIEIIIFPSNVYVDEKIIKKANDEQIALVKTDLLTHEVIIDLYRRGLI